MKKYTLKRIITSLFTLLAILLVLFILMQLMPGSPFNDEKLTPEMRASLYAKYGLDQPIYVQFFRYVTNMLRGDFGVSYNISKNTPISQLIQSRLPISIRVGGMAVTLGAIVGLVLGIIAALKRDTIFDTLATIISVIGVSVPSYVFALALSYTFGFKLRWFPILQVHHGIQIDRLPVYNLPRDATGGIELIHVIPAEERRDTVQLGIRAEVFGHVGKIWEPAIYGKQHTIAIKFVGSQALHPIHCAIRQITVFAVQHHHLH